MAYKDYLDVCEYIFGVLRVMANGEPLPKKSADVSWGAVYSIAKSHSLAGTLYYYVENKVKEEAPPELVLAWEQTRNTELVQNINQTAEFSAITELFTKEKIPFLPIKGFLMKALYPRSELRTMVDMDIYVHPFFYTKAKELLLARGYTVESSTSYEVHESLLKPPFINVELHRKLFSGDDSFSLETCNPKADNPHWYLMTDEDFYIFLLRHAHKHYSSGGGCGIRTVLDLFLYERAYPEISSSESFISKLREFGIEDFYLDITALSLYWFSGKSPERDISELEAFIITGGTYGNIKNRVAKKVKGKSKLAYAIGRIFPSRQIIYSRYKWVRKCKILLPIGYIVRIFTAIFNGRALEYVDAINSGERRASMADEVKEDK